MKYLRVLVVDPDVRNFRLVSWFLRSKWPNSITASEASGKKGIDYVTRESPDIVVVEIDLPGDMDGFETIRQIRTFSTLPIIVLTSREADEHLVEGLNMGADVYLMKPVSQELFLSHVNALLRRAKGQEKDGKALFQSGDLKIDFFTCRVTLASKEVNLTPTEYKLICYLADNAGQIITTTQLYNRIWIDEINTPRDHVLNVWINRLRKKIELDPQKPKIILTHSKIGYSLVKNNS